MKWLPQMPEKQSPPELVSALKKQLNPEQIEAVLSTEGPLLVLAGAGTGKTRVITFRIAHMLNRGVDPESILGMTFTNKAAREMRDRIALLVSRHNASKLFLGTFHSFCARLLRREIKNLGYAPSFTISGDRDQLALVKQAKADLGIIDDQPDPALCISLIGRAKNRLIGPEELQGLSQNDIEETVARIYGRYQKILFNQNTVDFDDLIGLTVRLFEEHPEVLKKYLNKYKYLLVDEYQDTNHAQFSLLRKLAGKSMNICVVGDDDQSIYGWRGAEIANILGFSKHFPGGREVKLEQNYRSTTCILNAANSVIAGNSKRYEKNLWSDKGEGEKIKIVRTESDEDEAQYIQGHILKFLRDVDGLIYSGIAVLYRSNHQSGTIENAMRQARIPYRIVGAKAFYERREIRDCACYLKLIVNPKDDQSFLRIAGVPARGLGNKALSAMKKNAFEKKKPLVDVLADEDLRKTMTSRGAAGAEKLHNCISKWREEIGAPGRLGEKCRAYIKETGLAEGIKNIYKKKEEHTQRLENIDELLNEISRYELRTGEENASLLDFLETYALEDDNDKVEENEKDDGNAVSLMTIHAAKGLEFPCIMLAGLEETLFPHQRSLDEGQLEEERRLFYVAVTRAMSRLVITYAGERMKYGKMEKRTPSRFLEELPEQFVNKVNPQDDIFKPMSKEEIKKAFEKFYAEFDF